MVMDMWKGAPTTSMEHLKSCWAPEKYPATAESLYEHEFKRHWENLDQASRDAELLKILQFGMPEWVGKGEAG